MNVYCFTCVLAGIWLTLVPYSIVFGDEEIIQVNNVTDLANITEKQDVNNSLNDDDLKITVIDDSIVVNANVNEAAAPIISDDTVTVDAIPNPSHATPDRNPLVDFFQNWFQGPGAPEPQVLLEPPDDCASCSCGIVNKKHRIVGGHETVVNQYPWMGLMQYNGRFYCGCSLINDRYVLTAAHCVQGFQARRISVVLLDHNRAKPEDTNIITRKVLRSVPHNGYSSSTFNNDIALLRLDKPVRFSDKIRPVCLPTKGKSFTGIDGIAAGWGALREGGSISDTLQEVIVPILSNKECKKTGYGNSRITDNMICAGFSKGGKDSCQGDSGGPLHIVNNTVMHIVGVVSWGEGCAQPNYPGVYSRVNRYWTWIKSNTNDACYCDDEYKKL